MDVSAEVSGYFMSGGFMPGADVFLFPAALYQINEGDDQSVTYFPPPAKMKSGQLFYSCASMDVNITITGMHHVYVQYMLCSQILTVSASGIFLVLFVSSCLHSSCTNGLCTWNAIFTTSWLESMAIHKVSSHPTLPYPPLPV